MSSEATRAPAQPFTFGFNDGTLGLIAIGILLFAAAVWSAHSPSVEKTDFSLTYVGAKIEHEGHGHDLYDIDLQKQVRNSLFQHPSPLFFEHPPFEALLFSPLATLHFRNAYAIWATVNTAVWLSLIVAFRKYCPWPADPIAYLFFWVLFAPLWVALYQGQSSILLLALYSITFASLAEGRDIKAGVVLGLGLFKLQFVLPFAFIFLLRKKWRFLVGFAMSATFLGMLSLFAVGLSGITAYVRFLLAIGSNPQNESYGSAVDMPTIHGLVYALLGHVVSRGMLNAIVMLLSLALLGIVAWQWQRGCEHKAFTWMFAAGVGAALVTGSHMFTHDFSPLILAMLLVAGDQPQIAAPPVARYAIILSLVAFWAVPIYFLFVAWHTMFLMCPILLLFIWGALAFARSSADSAVDLQSATSV